MRSMRTGPRVKTDTLGDVSPSESQEHIMGDTKTGAHVVTKPRRSNSSKSECLVLQGITVTHDVEVVRN
jgi:hypothetical protein